MLGFGVAGGGGRGRGGGAGGAGRGGGDRRGDQKSAKPSSSSWSSAGGARAEAMAGTVAGRPRWSRIRAVRSGSVMNARTRSLSPQLGQVVTSSPNTRSRKEPQSSRRASADIGGVAASASAT